MKIILSFLNKVLYYKALAVFGLLLARTADWNEKELKITHSRQDIDVILENGGAGTTKTSLNSSLHQIFQCWSKTSKCKCCFTIKIVLLMVFLLVVEIKQNN